MRLSNIELYNASFYLFPYNTASAGRHARLNIIRQIDFASSDILYCAYMYNMANHAIFHRTLLVPRGWVRKWVLAIFEKYFNDYNLAIGSNGETSKALS